MMKIRTERKIVAISHTIDFFVVEKQSDQETKEEENELTERVWERRQFFLWETRATNIKYK